jgi:hypothetical protein
MYRDKLNEKRDVLELLKLPSPKLEPPLDAVSFGGHRYKFISSDAKLRWSKANEVARGVGGRLASITTAEEQDFVANLCQKKRVWLGGTRSGKKWKWASSEAMEYQNWDEKAGAERYVMMLANGKWGTSALRPRRLTGYLIEWNDEADPAAEQKE